MSDKRPTCAVIIVTHNSQLHIHKAVKCLNEQTFLPNYIVLVDSGSQETSYLDAYVNDKTQVVLAGKDIGFCKGNNIGMTKIPRECDYVFFLNPDAFLTPTYIEKAIEFMEDPQNKQCAALTGILLGYDIHKDQPTGKYDSTGVFQTWYGKWYDRSQGELYDSAQYLQQEDAPAICGAALFCRKKALAEVLIRGNEVFDNKFFMYKEDIDLSLRLRKLGGRLIFLPQLIVYHCRGWNRDRTKIAREMRLFSAYNELKLHLRHCFPVAAVYSFLKYTAVKLFNV